MDRPVVPGEPKADDTDVVKEEKSVDLQAAKQDLLLGQFKEIFLKLDDQHKQVAIQWVLDREGTQE